AKNKICRGETIALNATGADTFVWDNNGGSGSSVSVKPLYTTLNTATGMHAGSGCTSNSSVLISVDPSPHVNIVADPPVSCENSEVLSFATGAESYIWNTGPSG